IRPPRATMIPSIRSRAGSLAQRESWFAPNKFLRYDRDCERADGLQEILRIDLIRLPARPLGLLAPSFRPNLEPSKGPSLAGGPAPCGSGSGGRRPGRPRLDDGGLSGARPSSKVSAPRS